MRFLFLLLLTQILPAEQIRVATYNASLAQSGEGDLVAMLRSGNNVKARRVAEIIQTIEPDILLVNEFDYDAAGTAATRLNDKFFNVSQNGRTAQNFPYRFVAISNTGIHSGVDLDNRNGIDVTPGDEAYGNDAFGFGEFPGKYAMAVFSKFPIRTGSVRTFEEVLWKEMPGNLLPVDFYSAEAQEIFRLSSKSHWDLPIEVNGKILHFLVSHPTPPVFDGAEDRNGKRNHDEIRLWADYLTPGAAGYLGGGLSEGARFVIAGDQNADPTRGDSVNAAINQLLNHPRVDSSFVPERTGASTAASLYNTSTFNLRVDYVLPSKAGFAIQGGAVFWPTGVEEGANLVTTSDHRPVYLDLEFEPIADELVRALNVERQEDDIILSWAGDPSASYGVEINPDLGANHWTALVDPVIEWSGEIASLTFAGAAPRGFLRVTVSME